MHIPPNEGTKSTGLITPWEKKKKKMKPICEYILGMMLFFFFVFLFCQLIKSAFFFLGEAVILHFKSDVLIIKCQTRSVKNYYYYYHYYYFSMVRFGKIK